MNYYSYFLVIIIIHLLNLTSVLVLPSRIANKINSLKNVSSTNIRERIRNRTAVQFDNSEEKFEVENTSITERVTSVVVITSLSGIYVWWPVLFGGDDSFHLLLSQEDVPRFHDVAGDNYGHIYLTAPHERTVYRLQYSNGWWTPYFSNHSVMNSIRSEMPLFLNIHYISSILYVYGHSDIQIIDLFQQPRARGSAPFMKRLRELSPNLRISDMIIDQLTSDGYIIGDSFGWCTVIRCSLGVNECKFLFKVPSSYDSRPYSCTATIDFSHKVMYLSLEEKILAVHLNEQTNFDRRRILTEKRGPRSTLGYDDIVAYNYSLLYTDVLRPLLHVCQLTSSYLCFNVSLTFSSPQRSILPLRLSVIQVKNLQPPILNNETDTELHINQTTTISPSTPIELIKDTTTALHRVTDDNSAKSYVNKEINSSSILILLLGICIGLLMAGISFMIYYILCNKNRPRLKKGNTIENFGTIIEPGDSKSPLDLINCALKSSNLKNHAEATNETSSELTTLTSSTLTYDPTVIL